jgi:hypothetical protein
MQHRRVYHPTCHRFEKFLVRDAVKVRGQIRVDDLRVTRVQQAMHLADRAQCVALGPIRVLLGLQIRLEDRS